MEKVYIENNLGDLLPSKGLPRSPLQYPGGKSKAVRKILACIPSNVSTVISPFIGGAWAELALDSLGIRVYGYDAFPLLVDFWSVATNNAREIASIAEEYYFPITKSIFKELQKTEFDTIIMRAVKFYVLNRASFSGRGMSGSMAEKQKGFKKSNLDFLMNFRANSMTIELKDFRDTIIENKDDTFMFLDPPYALGNNSEYYGRDGSMHRGFPHEELRDLLKNKDNWLMTYNNSDYIRDLFSGFRVVEPEQWAYGMFPGAEKSRELFIFSNNYPFVHINNA